MDAVSVWDTAFNGLIMKKILLFAFFALTAVSCTIETYDWENDRNWSNLKSYTDNVFLQFAVTPARDLALLLEVEDFMNLSEEEQKSEKWSDVRSKIQHYSETLLRIPSLGMNVDTWGVSLDVPGNYWLIEVYESYTHSNHSGYDYYYYDKYTSAPGHSTSKRVTCIEEGVYEVTDNKKTGVMEFTVTAIPSTDGGYDLIGGCTGSIIENENGLSSVFNFDEFYYKRQLVYVDCMNGDPVPTVIWQVEKLHGRIENFHNGSLLDWCEISIDLSKSPEPVYTSNMEVFDIPHTFPLE